MKNYEKIKYQIPIFQLPFLFGWLLNNNIHLSPHHFYYSVATHFPPRITLIFHTEVATLSIEFALLACRPHQIQLYPFVNFNWQTNTKNDFGWENKINFNNLFLVMWVNNCNKIIHLQNKCAVGIREFNKLSMRKLLWFHAIDFVDFFFCPPFGLIMLNDLS